MENMTLKLQQQYRRTQLGSAIVHLIYNEYGDLSLSETNAVLAALLNGSLQRNMRPKRK